ncbi:hypothetical protein I6I57_07625 [Brevibacterium casei]|uniref:hypothetical protein n=1 Tax=Brevibacterium casei TaxID=33889 RepID=UPI00191A3496|nr:hypothetical protein [Brevibacterium casei]QQT70713.1 hypothetical protein I6I57_07625 [Brevibacterium casei]
MAIPLPEKYARPAIEAVTQAMEENRRTVSCSVVVSESAVAPFSKSKTANASGEDIDIGPLIDWIEGQGWTLADLSYVPIIGSLNSLGSSTKIYAMMLFRRTATPQG